MVLRNLPVMNEPCTLPATLCHHDSFLGLPWRPLAALHFDGEGVLFVADWAIMNLANLSSFELILLQVSCKIDTCLVSCVIMDTCKTTVCESWVVVFSAGGIASVDFWQLLVVRLIFTELMAVLTLKLSQ